jgi:selenide,water dikinase
VSTDPALLVGPQSSDDAGVYRISAELALVETTDIITPLVDDPFTFGRIAAANAISDVYAMGGKPVTALNLLFAPPCLPAGVLGEILRGGGSVMAEAGVCLVGGHTVEDDELKYGLAVTGLIHPERIVRNNTPRSGDRLILTKPLGSGIISTAIKGEFASPGQISESVNWMTGLNWRAAELMLQCGATAATDVTGFGLLGHACEMASGGEVTLCFRLDAVSLMTGVSGLVAEGMTPAGAYRNRDHFGRYVSGISPADERLLPLFDPQTSGGLLIALPNDGADRFLALAAAEGLFAVETGSVMQRGDTPIVVI